MLHGLPLIRKSTNCIISSFKSKQMCRLTECALKISLSQLLWHIYHNEYAKRAVAIQQLENTAVLSHNCTQLYIYMYIYTYVYSHIHIYIVIHDTCMSAQPYNYCIFICFNAMNISTGSYPAIASYRIISKLHAGLHHKTSNMARLKSSQSCHNVPPKFPKMLRHVII